MRGTEKSKACESDDGQSAGQTGRSTGMGSEKLDGGRCYCLKDQETGKWTCTACGRQLEKIPGKPKNKDEIICPECGKTIVYLSRKRSVDAAGALRLCSRSMKKFP